MKVGWQELPLGDLVTFQRGLTYKKSDEVDTSSNVVLRANNIDLTTNSLDLTDLRYISDAVQVRDKFKILPGSLLVCTASGSRKHLGKVAEIITDDGYAFGGFMGQVTPTSRITSRYLFYLMTSRAYREYIEALTAGMNINNLRLDDLARFPVPVPPVKEQERIVAILDQVSKDIDMATSNAEAAALEAEALLASVMDSAFNTPKSNWVTQSVKSVCRIINGRAYKQAELLSEGKYPVLRVGNFFTNKHWYYSDLELEEDKYCDNGDLLYAWSASFGPRTWEGGKVIYHYHIWKVVPNRDLIEQDFLRWFLAWDVEKIKLAQGTGTTMMHVGKGSMEARSISVPNLTEQRKIVVALDEADSHRESLKSIYRQKITLLDSLKQSILHQAFSGNL